MLRSWCRDTTEMFVVLDWDPHMIDYWLELLIVQRRYGSFGFVIRCKPDVSTCLYVTLFHSIRKMSKYRMPCQTDLGCILLSLLEPIEDLSEDTSYLSPDNQLPRFQQHNQTISHISKPILSPPHSLIPHQPANTHQLSRIMAPSQILLVLE